MSEQIEAAARKLADLFETSGPLFTTASGSPKAFANGLEDAQNRIEERFNALSELAVLINHESEKSDEVQGAAIDLFQCSGFFYLALMQYSENLPNSLLMAGYDISVGRMPPVVSKALKGVSFAMKAAIAADVLFMCPHLANLTSQDEFEGRALVLLDKALAQAIARTDHAISSLKANEKLDGYEMTEEDNALHAHCQTCTDLLSKLAKHSANTQELTLRVAEFK
ncbi:hypothetical protein [Pseudovibrio sp. Tun.PSC04-5.I4]|uniref:hypothetical protein n=1 Tax=Pseudovibrio sp. Tun.PSC04-5.I4 TaxID=1798213 RepID=UPI00088FE38B|nr:hypothetical protein [Pseudovibrio sp. Tun.PSC04-5.I4]SDR28545.1 hypothetical protein SAMN04515695_4112 [Pseudovibrio sp. Tun.PSC04-5.I4]